jgi:exportin-T
VLDHFVGVHGLHNVDAKLRSRVSYLFCRFTKDLKLLLNTYIEKILNSIQDLLIISSPLEQEGPLSSDDQLFLYETVSILIVYSNLEPKLKSQLMKNLLTPVVSSFSLLLNKYLEQNDEKLKLVYANSLNVAMQIASRASKGFSHQVKIKDCECVEIFLEILRIFMPSINVLTHKNLIHSGFRQYLHRMIVCLDNEVLEYLPMTIEHLLNVNNEPKDLYDLTPLLNQILNKYKFQIVRFMQTILMRFVNGVLNYVNSLSNEMIRNLYKSSPHLHQPTSPTHTTASNGPTTNGISNGAVAQHLIDTQLIVDIQLLYKTYFQFLLNINNNELVEIVSGQAPSDIYKIFFSLIQGAQIGTQPYP